MVVRTFTYPVTEIRWPRAWVSPHEISSYRKLGTIPSGLWPTVWRWIVTLGGPALDPFTPPPGVTHIEWDKTIQKAISCAMEEYWASRDRDDDVTIDPLVDVTIDPM